MRMRHLYYTVGAFGLGALTFLTGCTAYDFEDVQPTDSFAYETAITDLTSAQTARTGIYDRLQITNAFDGYLGSWQYFSDEANFTGTFPTRAEFAGYNVQPSNVTMTGFFADFYQVINTSNAFISNLALAEDERLTPERRESLEGEARFARALAYLYLTQGWVNVPLVFTPTTSAGDQLLVTSSSQSEVYEQIEADLAFAAKRIDPRESLTMSAAAANGLRARVALLRGNYASAYELAIATLGSDSFDLTTLPFLKDDLFKIEYAAVDGNQFAFIYGPRSLNGRYEISPSPALINAFEPNDARFAQTIDTSVANQPYGLKYRDFQSAFNAQTDPLHIIRTSEVVLIAAEAAAAQGNFAEATRWLNQVRTRAGLPPLEELTEGNYLDAILQERFVELALEGGHRLWDLRRTGRAEDVLGPSGYDPCDDRWPYPQYEIDTNPNLEKNSACNS